MLVEPAPGCRSGRSGTGSVDSAFCPSAVWMRRSTSRTASRYSDDPRAVGRPERALQAREILVDAIEQAPLLPHAVEPLFRRAALAEQPLEHDARVVLDRKRRRRRLPRHRVHVGAAVARLALAAEHEIELRRDQLHRRQHGLLAELRRGNLIGRRAEADVGAFGLLRMHAAQPRGARARVLAVAVAQRFPLLLRQPADHRQPIAVTAPAATGSATARSSCLRPSASRSSGRRSSRRRSGHRRTPAGTSASRRLVTVAENAGTIASSSGSANAAPRPRRNVRRGSAIS